MVKEWNDDTNNKELYPDDFDQDTSKEKTILVSISMKRSEKREIDRLSRLCDRNFSNYVKWCSLRGSLR